MDRMGWISAALDHAVYLKEGLALCCAKVEDPAQREEIQRLINCLLEALKAEE